MKKKKLLLVVIAVLTLCGCEKTIPKLSNGSEAVVSFSNGEKISVDDLYEKMKNSYALELLVDMIDTKILEDKYKDVLKDADTYTDSYMESLKMYYTDDSGKYDEDKLISDIKSYYGYSSVEQFRESVRINYLRNKAIEDYAKKEVKDKDIKKYYKDEIVGDRKVSHILIIPDTKDNMTDDEKSSKLEEALAKAKEVIAKLKKGEKFEDLAKEYSQDENTKDSGGDLGFINKGTYGSDTFDEEVYKLKVGTYSNTPVKTNEGYEIVYVLEEKEKSSLEDVKDKIIETLSQEKINNDATIRVVALKELRKDYGLDIVDDEISSQYSRYINNAYNNALQK